MRSTRTMKSAAVTAPIAASKSIRGTAGVTVAAPRTRNPEPLFAINDYASVTGTEFAGYVRFFGLVHFSTGK